MTIADILSTKGGEVASVPAGTRVHEAVLCLGNRRIGAVPVLGPNGTIEGIFSERDLVASITEHGCDALDWPVEQVMSAPAMTVDTATPILAALSLMTNKRVRHLPVVESGQIRGIVSIGDLVKHRIERIEAEAAALRSYIQTA
jgi:CBS domain-containing protein